MRTKLKRAAGLAGVLGVIGVMPGCIIVATSRDGERLSRSEAECVQAIGPGETLPTVADRNAAGFAKLRAGMSLAEFKEAFPSAVFVKQYEESGKTMEVYSVTLRERLRHRDSRYAFTHTDQAWFEFHNGGLVGWSSKSEKSSK